MATILTLTLNPALDKTITVDELVPDKKLRSTYVKLEPGGGGINVSRAIKKLGGVSEAVYLCGGHTGQHFRELLDAEGVSSTALPVKGETRENFVVVEDKSDKQYRFGMEGAEVTGPEWQQALDHIAQSGPVDFLVASGSLPPGVPKDFFGRLANIAREKHARLVVDTSGEALRHAVTQGVYLIKPNLDELASLDGSDHPDPLAAARRIIAAGGAEVVVVSMGKQGALLVTATEQVQATPPEVEVHSTVGAGDSMVGGMVLALSQGKPMREALYYGVAAGTAATMNEGTELCKKEDTEQLFAQMKQQ